MKEPFEGMRKHKLLTDEIKKKLPKLYSTEYDKNPKVYLKLFSPYSNYTWYITEFDGEETFFGYTTGGFSNELGYISYSELANANRNGLPLVERDKSFRPKGLKEIKK